MAQSYSIVFACPEDPSPNERALAQAFYTDVEFASQLCSEFAATEISDGELCASLSNANDALRTILQHNAHLQAMPSKRQPAWPPHRALIRFDMNLHRLTRHRLFFKKWTPQFFVLRGSRLYYSSGKRGHPKSPEGSLAFMRSNPEPEGHYCVDLIGCSVVPCSTAVDGQAFALIIKFPSRPEAPEDICIAAADEDTRQRCMHIIRASSAAAYSSLQDIALAATMTSDLFGMQSLPAVNAVLSALGKGAVGGLDLPSLMAAGCHFLTYRAAGFDAQSLKDEGFTLAELKAAGCDLASAISAGYDVLSLIGAFGYRAVAASGFDVSMCLLKKSTGHVYATLHGHKVDGDIVVPDGDKPVPVPAGWKIVDQNAMLCNGVIGVVSVCSSNPWQSEWLVMADGRSYGTAMCRDPNYIGGTYHRLGTGKCLKQDAEGTRSTSCNYDLLLEIYAS